MTLLEQLQELEAQKQQLKIDAFKALSLREFTKDGVTVTISEISQEDNKLKIVMSWAGDKTGSDTILFRNPPVQVPDGTTHVETLYDGTEITVSNYKEDVEGALKQILSDVIKRKK